MYVWYPLFLYKTHENSNKIEIHTNHILAMCDCPRVDGRCILTVHAGGTLGLWIQITKERNLRELEPARMTMQAGVS